VLDLLPLGFFLDLVLSVLGCLLLGQLGLFVEFDDTDQPDQPYNSDYSSYSSSSARLSQIISTGLGGSTTNNKVPDPPAIWDHGDSTHDVEPEEKRAPVVSFDPGGDQYFSSEANDAK